MPRMFLVATAIAACCTNAFAQGDAERGKSKTIVCVTCHGSDGKATLSMYPNLSGQNYEYLVNSLKAYKAGQRKGNTAALMAAPVATLSDQDMQDLAAFYSSIGK